MGKAKEKFDLIEIDGEDRWCIKIKSGKYQDVVYRYNYVSVLEPEQGDEYATLKFDYGVIYEAELPEESVYGNREFETIVGDILYDLLMESEFKQPPKKEE